MKSERFGEDTMTDSTNSDSIKSIEIRLVKYPPNNDNIRYHLIKSINRHHIDSNQNTKYIFFRTFGWFDYLIMVINPKMRCILPSSNIPDYENLDKLNGMVSSFICWYEKNNDNNTSQNNCIELLITKKNLNDIDNQINEWRLIDNTIFDKLKEWEKDNSENKGLDLSSISKDEDKIKEIMEEVLKKHHTENNGHNNELNKKIKHILDILSEIQKYIKDERCIKNKIDKLENIFNCIYTPKFENNPIYILSFIKLDENSKKYGLLKLRKGLGTIKGKTIDSWIIFNYLGVWDFVVLVSINSDNISKIYDYKKKFLLNKDNGIIQSSSMILAPAPVDSIPLSKIDDK